MKACTKCGETKIEENFAFKIKVKNIRKTICKVCERIYKKAYYDKNKQDYSIRNKEYKKLFKTLIQESKTNCIVCGETEKICLDFHHLSNKNFSVSQGYQTGSIRRVKEEINKCVILCANCHRKLHAGLIKLI